MYNYYIFEGVTVGKWFHLQQAQRGQCYHPWRKGGHRVPRQFQSCSLTPFWESLLAKLGKTAYKGSEQRPNFGQ